MTRKLDIELLRNSVFNLRETENSLCCSIAARLNGQQQISHVRTRH